MALDFIVVSGTTGALAAFQTAVESAASSGYEPVGGPTAAGVNIYQAMAKYDGISPFVQQFPITAVVSGALGSFTVAGAHTADFTSGLRIQVVGSTGNDGVYTVKAPGSSISGPDTVIPIDQIIGDGTADGIIYTYV